MVELRLPFCPNMSALRKQLRDLGFKLAPVAKGAKPSVPQLLGPFEVTPAHPGGQKLGWMVTREVDYSTPGIHFVTFLMRHIHPNNVWLAETWIKDYLFASRGEWEAFPLIRPLEEWMSAYLAWLQQYNSTFSGPSSIRQSAKKKELIE